jgi:general stress protein 26
MSEHTKRLVVDFLSSQKLAHIATVSIENQPSIAAIYFISDPDLNFYFLSRKNTAKYRNIAGNSAVGLAITDPEEAVTLQVKGIASTVDDRQLQDDLLSKIWRITIEQNNWPAPIVKLKQGELVLLKITPKEIKYSDFKPLYLNEAVDYARYIKS